MNTFFNTINLSGESLQLEINKADAQEKAVLEIFERYPQYSFRTYDIEQLLISNLSNHDGVKRAISVLTKNGKLIRSKKACCPGPYHLKVNVWQLACKTE